MFQKWKRGTAVLLALLLVLWTAGCGSTAAETGAPAAAQVTADTEEATESQAESEEAQTETVTEQTGALETGDISAAEAGAQAELSEDGSYTSKEEVALYLHTYGHLPDNYISKKEAESLGWDSKKGNLWDVAPGMSIGGSRFGNYEGLLPEKDGRKYYECDIDYDGEYRGAKRLVYSSDGLIFYTEDHYKTFEQLY